MSVVSASAELRELEEKENISQQKVSKPPQLSAVKVDHLKRLIDAHLRKNDVYAQIREFVKEYASKTEEIEGDTFDVLKEKKVIEQVIKSMDVNLGSLRIEHDTTVEKTEVKIKPDKQYLHIKVLPGRAFMNEFASFKDHSYILRIHCCDSRFESKPVKCIEEPPFDESFLVELKQGESEALYKSSGEQKMTPTRLLGMNNSCVHIVLMRQAPGIDGEMEVIASHELEWRRILERNGGASVTVELTGIDSTSKSRLSIGILDIRLELVPGLSSSNGALFKKGEVDKSLKIESSHKVECHRRFCQYARMWWQEYVEINDSFRNRLVKIFAENEWGEHQPVCTFVNPMSCGRLLESPRQAARFLSLLSYVPEEIVGGGRLEVWRTPHTFLSAGQGDCEDHALLLCSILLGFGLKAYVCIGTILEEGNMKERDHVWVVTLSGRNNCNVVFWESLTGQKIELNDQNLNIPYLRIGCMFNHNSFYANKQIDDTIANCCFDIDDDVAWKSMDERLLEALDHVRPVPLVPSNFNHYEVSEAIETSLGGLIAAYRASNFNLSTYWDKQFCYYLSPALAAYENERVSGIAFGNEEFQSTIKAYIPHGHSFKGFPIMFNHRNPHKMMDALIGSAIAMDILKTRGDHTHFALRVRLFPYPEGQCALWVLLAVRYRSS